MKTYWYVRFTVTDVFRDFMFSIGIASSAIYYCMVGSNNNENLRITKSLTTNSYVNDSKGFSNKVESNSSSSLFSNKSDTVIGIFNLKKSIDLSKYGNSSIDESFLGSISLDFRGKVDYLSLSGNKSLCKNNNLQLSYLGKEFYTSNMSSLGSLNTDYMVIDSGMLNSSIKDDLGLSNQVNQVSKSVDLAKQDR